MARLGNKGPEAALVSVNVFISLYFSSSVMEAHTYSTVHTHTHTCTLCSALWQSQPHTHSLTHALSFNTKQNTHKTTCLPTHRRKHHDLPDRFTCSSLPHPFCHEDVFDATIFNWSHNRTNLEI